MSFLLTNVIMAYNEIRLTREQEGKLDYLFAYVKKFLLNKSKHKAIEEIRYKTSTNLGENRVALTMVGGVNYSPLIILDPKVLELKDNNAHPLTCWSVVILYHEFVHALMYLDTKEDIGEKHDDNFRANCEVYHACTRDHANEVYIENAKLESSGVKMCLNPNKCEICDDYKLSLSGKKKGRPISKWGKRRKLNW